MTQKTINWGKEQQIQMLLFVIITFFLSFYLGYNFFQSQNEPPNIRFIYSLLSLLSGGCSIYFLISFIKEKDCRSTYTFEDDRFIVEHYISKDQYEKKEYNIENLKSLSLLEREKKQLTNQGRDFYNLMTVKKVMIYRLFLFLKNQEEPIDLLPYANLSTPKLKDLADWIHQQMTLFKNISQN